MDEFKEPLSRVEAILQNILGADNELSDPESRVEAILLSILNDTPYTDLPQSRVEEELLAIKNGGTYTRDILSKVEDILLYKLNNEKYPEESSERVEELLIEWTDAVIEKQASGSIISVDDAVAAPLVSAEVDINPVQDLHGYDNPWPAGGGKNIANYPQMISDGAVQQADGSLYVAKANTFNDKVIYQNDGTVGQFAITFIVKNNSTSRGLYPVIVYTDSTTESMAINFGYDTYTTFTKVSQSAKTIDKIVFRYGTGSIATWFYVQVEKGNTATSWSPYSNICPISGWNECKVTKGNKNLYDYASATKSNSNIRLGGTQYADGSFVLKAGTYTLSTNATMTGMYIKDKDGTTFAVKYNNSFITFTITKEQPVLLDIYLNASAQDWSVYNIQLELGSTATSYSPYQGNLYTISLGQTVYGGRLDVINGELVVDRVKVTFDGSDDEGWIKYGTQTSSWTRQSWRTQSLPYSIKQRTYPITDCIGNGAVILANTSENTSANDNIITGRPTSYKSKFFYIFTPLSLNYTVEDLKALLSATPLEFCYPLAEDNVITISLTPTQIEMLENDNVLYADTGDLAITYKAKEEE